MKMKFMDVCTSLAVFFLISFVSGLKNHNEDGTFQIRMVEFQRMQKRMKVLEEMVEKQTEIIHFQNERIYKLESVSGLDNPKSVIVNNEIKEKFRHNIRTSLLRSNTMGFQSSNDVEKGELWQLQRDIFMRDVPRRNGSTSMVAFYTYMDYNQKEIGTHHVFVFDRVVLNYGNGYHEYSGVFSAPRSGLYMFVWSLRVWEQSVVLIVAGSTYTSMYNRSYREDYTYDGEYSDADETASSFALVHLNEGDDVYLRTHSSYSGTGGVISNEYGRSSFGGWLLMHV